MPTAGAGSGGVRSPRLRGAALLLAAALWRAAPCGAQEAPALDFLYIDSAVDDSAGGHTAVRLGDTVFHYQYYPDGLFLLVKDPWEGFRRRYNDLENRSLTLSRVPLSRDAYDRLRSHFYTGFVLQEQRIGVLDRLTEEQALLQRLAAGEDSLALEGLGFFSETRSGDAHARELKGSVERALGETWLQERLHEVAGEVASISFRAPPGWSVRLRERLALREALTVLEVSHGLADDALLAAAGSGGLLAPAEYAVWEEFRGHLAASVLSLLGSTRPDRGTALLLQIARYLAVSRSLDTGEIATLDPFPDRAGPATPAATRANDAGDGRLARESRAAFASLRDAFVAEADLRGVLYSRIEAAQGRLYALEHAGRGLPEALAEDHLLPCRSRPVRTGLQGVVGEFSQAAGATAANRARSRADLEESYRYNLLTRNCVTELVRDVNDAFESREQEREGLGGLLRPGERLSFIPFLLPSAVHAAFPAAQSEFMPSYRLRQLDRLYERSGPFVWLRENNALTSTLYAPREEQDSVFLFFTDDVVAPRPLLGSLNLLYAAAHAAGGLLWAPADGGDLLVRSLRGMLYSLPEMAFFNIRKGSFGDVAEAPAALP